MSLKTLREQMGAQIARNEDSVQKAISGKESEIRSLKKTISTLREEMDEFSNREEDLILRTQSQYVNEIKSLRSSLSLTRENLKDYMRERGGHPKCSSSIENEINQLKKNVSEIERD